MIVARNLTKYFGSFRAVENISFTVEKGEIVGLIGPNGSGKTTIMRILTCFMPPTRGTASIGGYDVVKDSLVVRKYIGYFPEGAPLYSNLPVKTYLKFVAEVKGVATNLIKKNVQKVMEICSITHVSNRYIEYLSKGYRQRVCLAQAIINDPPVLILDEPTVGLDPKQVVEVRSLIKKLSGKRTVILSSHILSEISAICDKIIIINKGNIIAQDTISNLSKIAQKEGQLILKVRNIPENGIENLCDELSLDIISKEYKMENGKQIYKYAISADDDIRYVISNKIITNGWELLEIYFKGITLEDIYLKLISE